MKKCDCYCTEEKIIGWHTPADPKTTIVHKCNGTRERDECSCGGDRTKCDFYPKVREKALSKSSEWISVEDKLPFHSGRYLTHCMVYDQSLVTILWYDKSGYGFDKEVTHWMPLPAPPTEKEN